MRTSVDSKIRKIGELQGTRLCRIPISCLRRASYIPQTLLKDIVSGHPVNKCKLKRSESEAVFPAKIVYGDESRAMVIYVFASLYKIQDLMCLAEPHESSST